MPRKPIDEDRARRKELLEQKRAARRAATAAQEAQGQEVSDVGDGQRHGKTVKAALTTESEDSIFEKSSPLLELPEVAIQAIFALLPAADLGRLTLTCRTLNDQLPAARVPFLVDRLCRPNLPLPGCVGFVDLCRDEAAARTLLERSLHGGGDTGRVVGGVVPSKKRGKSGGVTDGTANEFVAYARFLEEVIHGCSSLSSLLDRGSGSNTASQSQSTIRLPRFVQGRFASVSPEHSLCRVGGDGTLCGPGGSGVASWGVGRRGQLGHGQRQDERVPRRMLGGLGYGVRIVQVSAGGGLVRVAHSLLLTSTGRVLSFGAGQYGALGHGYSSGKQLPDVMKPRYIECLNHVKCVCVAAGELHSAIVTSDGDVYTWGDGFCGQLGHGDKRPQLLPKQVSLGGLEDECVASVSCGSRHTMAVTEDGEVYTWGLGHFGCLGRSYTPFDYDADAAVAGFAGAGGPDLEQPLLAGNDHDGAAPAVEAPALEPRDYAAELAAHIDLIANLSLDDSSTQCIPQPVESLQGVQLVGCSAGHRHSLFLSDGGALYSCGTGVGGCLGHGDTESHMYPMKITAFDEAGVRIRQMSAGVDLSMAVTTTGTVYAWGKADGGRIGLGLARHDVPLPRLVSIVDPDDGTPVKGVDVECGYVHSLIVGLGGTLHMCGSVGVEDEADGIQQRGDDPVDAGRPSQVPNFNIWHRLPEPSVAVKKERWKKFGKYEVKGRTKMLSASNDGTTS